MNKLPPDVRNMIDIDAVKKTCQKNLVSDYIEAELARLAAGLFMLNHKILVTMPCDLVPACIEIECIYK